MATSEAFSAVGEPGDYAVVTLDRATKTVQVVCLRDDWESPEGPRAVILGPDGPVRAHEVAEHGSRP